MVESGVIRPIAWACGEPFLWASQQEMEDIPLLIERFRILFNGKDALGIEGLAPRAPQRPGNVRTLSKALKEAMILREGGEFSRTTSGLSRAHDPGGNWPGRRRARRNQPSWQGHDRRRASGRRRR